jgi:hypothetical protein
MQTSRIGGFAVFRSRLAKTMLMTLAVSSLFLAGLLFVAAGSTVCLLAASHFAPPLSPSASEQPAPPANDNFGLREHTPTYPN